MALELMYYIKRDFLVCLSCAVYQVVLNAVHNQMPYGCPGRLQPQFCGCPELWIPSPLELLWHER